MESDIYPSLPDHEEHDLYREFAARLGFKNSKILPMIAHKLMTPDQARVVLALPSNSEEIAHKLGMTEQFVNNTLEEMNEKAVVVPTRKGLRLTRNIIQLHDGFVTAKWADILGTEYLDLWSLFEITERWDGIKDSEYAGKYPMLKVIPKWQTVKDNPNLIPLEDVREIYKSHDLIAVNRCSCRRVNWDCACQAPAEVCILFDGTAEYQTGRGNARVISYEEAMEIEDMSVDHVLVTIAPNFSPQAVVCHCGMDHCVEFRTVRAANNALCNPSVIDWKRYFYRSRYLAVVDSDKCSGCQTCLEKCPFAVIEMKPAGYLKKWKAWVNPDKCVGCGLCALKCTKQAITLNLVRPDQIYPETVQQVFGG